MDNIQIQAFPLDNTPYLAEDLRKWFFTRTTGVYAADDNLAVSLLDYHSVKVEPGIAYLNDGEGGVVSWSKEPLLLIHDDHHGTYDRWDTVVVRWNKKDNQLQLDLVTGVPSADPVPTPPQRDEGAYEIVIAKVFIKAGMEIIEPKDVYDTRLDESVCGLMRDGVTGIPSQQLYDQFNADTEALMQQFSGFSQELITEVNSWYQEVKDKISKTDVETLQSEINEVSEKADEALGKVNDLVDTFYPIGTVITNSKASFNPNTLYVGTTWVRIKGKVIVGVDENDASFKDGVSGGEKAHALTANEMPSHTHGQNAHNHGQNAHNHSQAAHNHSQKAHNHGASSGSAGSHTHAFQGYYQPNNAYGGAVLSRDRISGDPNSTPGSMGASGAHTHTISIGNATAVNNAATATNTATTATNIAATAVNQSTGGNQAHNNLQPYITKYVWERTA